MNIFDVSGPMFDTFHALFSVVLTPSLRFLSHPSLNFSCLSTYDSLKVGIRSLTLCELLPMSPRDVTSI